MRRNNSDGGGRPAGQRTGHRPPSNRIERAGQPVLSEANSRPAGSLAHSRSEGAVRGLLHAALQRTISLDPANRADLHERRNSLERCRPAKKRPSSRSSGRGRSQSAGGAAEDNCEAAVGKVAHGVAKWAAESGTMAADTPATTGPSSSQEQQHEERQKQTQPSSSQTARQSSAAAAAGDEGDSARSTARSSGGNRRAWAWPEVAQHVEGACAAGARRQQAAEGRPARARDASPRRQPAGKAQQATSGSAAEAEGSQQAGRPSAESKGAARSRRPAPQAGHCSPGAAPHPLDAAGPLSRLFFG